MRRRRRPGALVKSGLPPTSRRPSILNAIEHAQAELQQKHEERIKALEAEHMVTVLINDPASVPACDVTYLVEGHLMDARAQGE